MTYHLEEDPMPSLYTFRDKIPVQIFDEKLEIDFAGFADVLESIPE